MVLLEAVDVTLSSSTSSEACRPGDVRDGLREALAADGPALVDVLTDPNALSMPPKITGEQVKGFALAMSKLVLSGDADEVVNMARSNLRNLPRP